MGEMGCKMTLEALGEIVDFVCEESEDEPILKGSVEFGSVESAKKAIEQYDGMDMGIDRRAHVWTPVTSRSRMPSSAWKKKKQKSKKKKKNIKKKKKNRESINTSLDISYVSIK